jgi:acyl-CoA hydrolase
VFFGYLFKEAVKLKNKLLQEIEDKGLEFVARILKNTPLELEQKLDHPDLFMLSDITALRESGYLNKEVRLILDI